MERLTIREACERLRCSRWTLDRLFRSGKLAKITTADRKVYVDAAELNDYIRRTYPAPMPATPAATMAGDELNHVLRNAARVPEVVASIKQVA